MSATKTSAKVPKLRFPGFDQPWQRQALGAVGQFKNGLNKGKEDFGFGYPFVNLMDVFGRSTLSSASFGLVNATDADLQAYDLTAGDVLFIRSSVKREGVGEAILVAEDLPNTVYSGFLIRFREHGSTLVPGFKRHGFGVRQFRQQVLSLATTSANTNINQDSLEQVEVSYPIEAEQKKIAAFLTAVDGRIGQLSQKKALLEDYKKGVMQQLFTQALRFKDDHANEFPDWEEKTLGAISSFSKGCGISKAEVHEDGALPCIRYGELYTHYSELIRAVKSRTNVPEKDLVLSKRNDVIIPASGETHIDIATASCVTVDGVALGGDLNIIRTKQNGVFLAYYLNNACKHAIAGMAQGSSVIHLYPDQLKRLRLHLPSLKEQTKIANFLTALDRKIESVAQQITHTQAFKKGLLQQMFV